MAQSDDELWAFLNKLGVEFETMSDSEKWQHQQEWNAIACLLKRRRVSGQLDVMIGTPSIISTPVL